MAKNYKIRLSPPNLSADVIAQAFNHQKFDFAYPGKSVNNFQDKLSALLDVPHCLAVNSGTSALHLALLLLNVQEEDEVICPTFTFAATANVIKYQKATPVFIDSEKNTWNLCPDLLKIAIQDRLSKGHRPKVVIVVHNYGMPAKMDEIMKVCQEYEIPVVEDAAGAFGSSYRGKMVGTLGKFGAFSFNYNKIITTGGGGALVTHKTTECKRARYLATQAKSEEPYYKHCAIGYNYMMSGLAAALGDQQLAQLQKTIQRKKEIYNHYFHQLNNLSGITFISDNELHISNRWLSTLLFDKQNKVRKVKSALNEKGIESRYLWKPMHEQPVFSEYPKYLNGNSSWLFHHGLCLPSGRDLSAEDQNIIIEEIIHGVNL